MREQIIAGLVHKKCAGRSMADIAMHAKISSAKRIELMMAWPRYHDDKGQTKMPKAGSIEVDFLDKTNPAQKINYPSGSAIGLAI